MHTYHGHVLEGYFGRSKNATYRGLERRLASVSDALIGVSTATVDDLVRLGRRAALEVPGDPDRPGPGPFLNADAGDGAAFRARRAVQDGELLLTFVGRLVPDQAGGRAAAGVRARARARRARAARVVGDGALRPELERARGRARVADARLFAGYRATWCPVARPRTSRC